jgi:hypothetical protein
MTNYRDFFTTNHRELKNASFEKRLVYVNVLFCFGSHNGFPSSIVQVVVASIWVCTTRNWPCTLPLSGVLK